MGTSPESSLMDWLRLATDMAMPLALFGLGFLAKTYADRLERRRRLFEVESAWRLEVFRELLSHLNNIFCYYTYQGDWRSMSPDDAIVSKRGSDRIVHMNRFLWSGDFLDAYKKFATVAFAENQGPSRTFLLRANVERHKENPRWEPAWEGCFAPEAERVDRETFTTAYDYMLSLAVRDLGIVSDADQV